MGRARAGGVGAGVELAGEGDACLVGLEGDLGGIRLARRSRRGRDRDGRGRDVRGSRNDCRGQGRRRLLRLRRRLRLGLRRGLRLRGGLRLRHVRELRGRFRGLGRWRRDSRGGRRLRPSTFALAASLGFDAVFFACFGLAAAVVVAFGTIGTTVSTASVALTGPSVAAGGAVETDSSTARSGLRASSTPSAVPVAASRSPAAPASRINAGRRTRKRRLPVCQ